MFIRGVTSTLNNPVEPHPQAVGSSQVVHAASERPHAPTAMLVDEDARAGDDRRVRPLWMITAFLGAYFAALAIALMLD